MMRLVRQILSRFHALARDNRGIAAVEFALVVPVMLVMYMGSIELSDAITVDRRLSHVAGALGDLVSRTDGNLPSATLTDYFKAAQGVFTPYKTASLKQVITLVYVDNSGSATVTWSQGYNGGVAHTADADYDLPSEMASISKDSYVVVAEAFYSYAPLMSYFFSTNFALSKQYFYMPRYGEAITLT